MDEQASPQEGKEKTSCVDTVAPIFSGVVDMDPPLSPGGRRTYDLCGTCKRTMDNEVPGIMYLHNNEQTVTHRLYTGLYCNKM